MNYFASSAFPEVNKNQPSLNWITCMKKLSQRGDKILTDVPSLRRKALCGRSLWPSSRSWHSWWRLCPPAPPRAQWGWSGRRHRAMWRRTPRRARGDKGLLRGERDGALKVSPTGYDESSYKNFFFFFFLKLIVRMNCLSNPRVWTPFSKKFKSGEECQHSWFACTPSVFVWKHNQLSK